MDHASKEPDHFDPSRRSTWPIRIYPLGHQPSDDLSASTTAEERIAMMWPLAVQAWALARLPMPDYDRRHTPVRLVPPKLDRSDR